MTRPVEIKLTPTIEIIIEAVRTPEEEEEGKWVADESGLILAFLDWQKDNNIFPIPGGMVGPGTLVQYFDARHETAIREFLNVSAPVQEDEATFP
jgi:hypothetical protein